MALDTMQPFQESGLFAWLMGNILSPARGYGEAEVVPARGDGRARKITSSVIFHGSPLPPAAREPCSAVQKPVSSASISSDPIRRTFVSKTSYQDVEDPCRPSYSAQQESRATSVLNPNAASFNPSTVVR